MQLLSVDFSFKAVWLLTVHQVLISGARDEPSSDYIRHGEAITVGPFLVMVYSPKWQGHWLSAGYGYVCMSAFPAELRRSARTQTEVEADEGSNTSGSSICNSNQAVYHTGALHYQPAPCWEIYLNTVILSVKQLSIRTHTWLVLQRHRLIFHFRVRKKCYATAQVYCAKDVWNHVESWKGCKTCLHEACECVRSTQYIL